MKEYFNCEKRKCRFFIFLFPPNQIVDEWKILLSKYIKKANFAGLKSGQKSCGLKEIRLV